MWIKHARLIDRTTDRGAERIDGAGEYQPPETYEGEYLAYLKDFIDGKAVFKDYPTIGQLAKASSVTGALDFAIRYANERIQFGKPISSFQAIQFMIADMATRVEAARSLVYKTASRIDEKPEEREKLSHPLGSR